MLGVSPENKIGSFLPNGTSLASSSQPSPRKISFLRGFFNFLSVIFSSIFLKYSSPLVSNIFLIFVFKFFSISLSISTKFNLNFLTLLQ